MILIWMCWCSVLVSRGVGWGGSRRCGGDQRVGHSGGGVVERSRAACQDDASSFSWLTAYGDGLDAVGSHVEGGRGERRDGQPGGHDLELGKPVAHDVADVGTLCQSRPHPEQCVAGARSACDPDLAGELLHIDDLGVGERVASGDADHQLSL